MLASPVSVANEQSFWTMWKRVIWIAICGVTTASRFVLSADSGAESNQTSAGLDFPVKWTVKYTQIHNTLEVKFRAFFDLM